MAMHTMTAHSMDVRKGLTTQNAAVTSSVRKNTANVACVMSDEVRWGSAMKTRHIIAPTATSSQCHGLLTFQ